jgi:hypothetical protein
MAPLYAPPGAMPGGMPGGPGGMPGMGPGGMPGMGPMGGPMPGPMPVGYGPSPNAYGMYGAASPEMMNGSMPMDGGCQYCGGMGCDMCSTGHGHGLHNGLLGDCFGLVAPYPDGGCAAVRWFDVALDVLYLDRSDSVNNLIISTFGQAGVGGVALQLDDLDLEPEFGMRFIAATQIGPASNLEFTFYGLFEYEDQAVALRRGPLATDGLFSIISDFGTDPPGGFAETDNADRHAITYESEFNNFELNFRQRWMAPNCRYQGSWLWGARYTQVDERFTLESTATVGNLPGDPPREMNFTVDANNYMTGLQIGGDMWVCILPGLRMGAEAKGGVFYNSMNVDTIIHVSTLPIAQPTNPFTESIDHADVAFVGNADFWVTYRINYNWTARAGYHITFVDGLALAPTNFNPDPPVGPFGPGGAARVPFVNDNGNIIYHGFTAGVEYLW